MRRATFYTDEGVLQGNEYFNPLSRYNSDGLLVPWIKLKESLALHGYDLATQDIHPVNASDVVIFMNVPKAPFVKRAGQKAFLLQWEPPAVDRGNWDPKNHTQFNRVFTWCDDVADGKKYVLLRFGFKWHQQMARDPFNSRKMYTLIAGCKKSRHARELYSERVRAIAWFSKHHPEDFDFYGSGWQEFFDSPLRKTFQRVVLRKIFEKLFLSSDCFRGRVNSKLDVLRKYRFSICYENMYGWPGFITEKIFDSFWAGCVPVYWGASNIADLIPEDCWIDRKKFNSYDDLDRYLRNISSDEYEGYINRIDAFLNSERALPFHADTMVKSMLDFIFK